jgi:spore coat polysaccharide biosynthesis protein SpsF (cytidylyltransferase family)
MNLIVIIQSRMTSRRYPGKMLAPFLGKPVLAHVVHRLKKTLINPLIVLATSDEIADDPLAIYSQQLGLKVVRGSRDDVMKRFILSLKQYKCDAFFRVCGDSPLLLPFLFDKAVSIFKSSSYDLVTNIYPRTFPVGMSVELIKTKTFIETEKKIIDKEDREHITKYFYNHSNDFQINNIECLKTINPKLKLAVDEPEDIQKLEEWHLKNGTNYEEIFPVLS